jgi:hypothetical protein
MPNWQTYRENPPKRLLASLTCSSRLHFSVQAAAGSGIENVSHKAAFAAFFFALGIGATVAFMFVFKTPFCTAHRLICTCRMRSLASALILRRFLVF